MIQLAAVCFLRQSCSISQALLPTGSQAARPAPWQTAQRQPVTPTAATHWDSVKPAGGTGQIYLTQLRKAANC